MLRIFCEEEKEKHCNKTKVAQLKKMFLYLVARINVLERPY